MALSLAPKAVSVLGADSSRSTSASLRVFGNDRPKRKGNKLVVGFNDMIFSRVKKR